MGGAQPLAVSMLDGVCLVRRRRPAPPRAPRRDALPRPRRARPRRRPARGRGGARGGRRALDRHRRLGRRGLPRPARAGRPPGHRHRPDERARSARRLRPRRALARRCRRAARERPAALHRALACLDGGPLRRHGRVPGARARRSSTTATACARRPARAASTSAFAYPGFVEAYVRPLFCTGTGPFRWAALSGDPDDIAATDAAVRRAVPRERAPAAVARAGAHARSRTRACRRASAGSGYGERHRAGLRFNELVRSGEVSAPIVIGRDHLDSGSVASPYRETEGMMDGSDAIADWPILNALLGVVLGRGLGRRPPRRRRRHRPLDPLGRAGRRRRHRRGRAAGRARADERSGHGRDAPRRRGLRAGARRPRASAASTCPCCRDPRRCSSPTSCSSPAATRARGRCRRARRRAGSSRIVDAAGGGRADADVVRLPGRLLVPGCVNGHSHAFQRHLRGRVEVRDPRRARRTTSGRGARRCTRRPRRSTRAGCAAVAEECFDAGRRAGYTAVGEFHYVHHRPDGTPYEEPERARARGHRGCAHGRRAHRAAAGRVRPRGRGAGAGAGQRRFCDRSVEAYLDAASSASRPRSRAIRW